MGHFAAGPLPFVARN